MKKMLIILLAVSITAVLCLSATSCSKMMGDKEVAVVIQKIITAHKVEGNTEVKVALVQFGFNINKIYVELPEYEGKEPSTIVIKKVDKTSKFIILDDSGKAKTVSNHAYEFYKWGN